MTIESKFDTVINFFTEKYIENEGILTKNELNELKVSINNSQFKSINDNSSLVVLDIDIKHLKDISNAEIISEENLTNIFNINLETEKTLKTIISNHPDAVDYCNNMISTLDKAISVCGDVPETPKLVVYEDKLMLLFYSNKSNDRRVLLCSKNEIQIKSVKSACPVMSECPFKPTVNNNNIWWPNQLDLRPLYQFNPMTSPYDQNFDYVKEFNSLNLNEVKSDLVQVLTNSQNWWPADYGNYGPFLVRMAWHSAGTYRSGDGRGGGGSGLSRFAPLNSWPDNGNLDKARRLIWPVKQKYGKKISWADLMILAGNVALESMGFKIIGYGGGRVDVWETDYYTYWGSETEMFDNNKRYTSDGQLEKPLSATNMGLIYVNAEGPNGNPDPILAAHDIRTVFGRMGMNDEETVALIAGGHTIGKCHGAASGDYLGPPPESAPIEQMNFGWKNSYQTGKGPDTITSGFELTWTNTPTKFSMSYLRYLIELEWELMKSPAGAYQWFATNTGAYIPDAFNPNIKYTPMMLTTDLSLRFDPAYYKISLKYLQNPELFRDAFANAWFKLTHRDMGPKVRYLGPEVPVRNFIWQDPIPAVNHKLVLPSDVSDLKEQITQSGLSVYELVYTAWSSASTFRKTDKRGGANGARIRLLPMKFWKVNQQVQLSRVLTILETIQTDFNRRKTDGTKVSLADLIVLAGSVGIEQAAKAAGQNIIVPFIPGRMDATQEQTDIDSFNYLEPKADGFRNYINQNLSKESEKLLIEKAEFLSLTGPEMTVLIGGLRAMAINFEKSSNGVLTNRPGMLTTDFFINILDTTTVWKPTCKDETLYEGYNSNSQKLLWKATRCDLIFGSNSQLRAYCEVYASADAQNKFLYDFIQAWTKVMNNDRYDLK